MLVSYSHNASIKNTLEPVAPPCLNINPWRATGTLFMLNSIVLNLPKVALSILVASKKLLREKEKAAQDTPRRPEAVC